MTIRELVTKWGFEVDHSPLEKVEHQLEQIKGRLEFLAAAEVVKGIYELTERFAHFAEQIHIAAVSAGLTVEAFQKLSFAAGLANVGSDQLSGAMARLSRHIYGARQGSIEAQKAFMDAGFSQDQITSFKTGQDVLLALSDRFKDMQDPIQKQAIAMQLLGRGSTEMVGFLSQGSAALKATGIEASKLGIVLGEHQIQALTRLEEALNTVSAVVKGFGATLASYFAPSVQSALEEILHFYEANRKLIDTNVRQWVWDITYAMGAVWAVVKFVAQAFFDFANQHPLLVRRITEVVVALGALAGAIFFAQKAIGLLKGAIGLLGLAFKPLQFGANIGFKPIIWLAGLAQKAIGWILLRLATLVVTMFPALGEALLSFAALVEATPIGWFITAIVALIVVVHDLYEVFFNGKSFKDTWIGQAFEFAKGAFGKVKDMLGFGDSGEGFSAEKVIQNVNSVADMAGNGGKFFTKATVSAGLGNTENSNQINAPVTINVPAGTDPQMVGQKVKEGIKEHLDRVSRETSRSLQPGIAY